MKSQLFNLLNKTKFFLDNGNYTTVMSILSAEGFRWIDGSNPNEYVSCYLRDDGICCIYIDELYTTYPRVISHSEYEWGVRRDEYGIVNIEELLIQHNYIPNMISDDININISMEDILSYL